MSMNMSTITSTIMSTITSITMSTIMSIIMSTITMATPTASCGKSALPPCC